ncbi:MAG: MFS transporter [Promethearchaeota archaeon]|nr:MAG: MFS transporter [Candidatus Lokiarchaeota archaeon]
MSEKLSKNLVISVFLLSLAGEIAWAVENQFYNDFIDETLIDLGFPWLSPIAIMLLVNITTVVGTIATIIMGSYSDIKGKRKPILLYGFIFWAITTAIFPLSALFGFLGVYFVIFMAILFDSIMTFFGGMAKNAGVNAYITDVTNLKTRSKAVGIAQITVLLSLLIVYGALGMLIDFIGYYTFFVLVGILVGLIGLLGVFKTEEPRGLEPMQISTYEHIKNTFKKKANVDYKAFIMVLLVICAWQIALNIIFPYLLVYLKHHLGNRMLSLVIFFVALVISIILSYPIGKITNKLGRKKTTFISVICISIGYFAVGLSFDFITYLISGVVVFVFYTALSVSTFTWVKDLYPPEGRGQFSGYWNLFSGTIPMLIGPLIGGTLSTVFGYTAIVGGEEVWMHPELIFFAASIVVLITLIPLYFAKEVKK